MSYFRARYFAAEYFAASYFGGSGGAQAQEVQVVITSAGVLLAVVPAMAAVATDAASAMMMLSASRGAVTADVSAANVAASVAQDVQAS